MRRARLGHVDRVDRPLQGRVAELVLVETAAGRLAVEPARSAAGVYSLRREHGALLALAGCPGSLAVWDSLG